MCHLCRMTHIQKQTDIRSSISGDAAKELKATSRPATPSGNKPHQITTNGNGSRKSSVSEPSHGLDRDIKTELISLTNGASERSDKSEITNGVAEKVADEAAPVAAAADESVAEAVKCEEAAAEEEGDEAGASDLRSSLGELVRAASILNPKQFELPRELIIFPKFPGDEKGISPNQSCGAIRN